MTTNKGISKQAAEYKLKRVLAAKYRKLKAEAEMMKYRRDPVLWLEKRFGEAATNVEWSKFDKYKNHLWDGDIDPLAGAWRRLAEGDLTWAGIKSASGVGKTFTIARIVFWFLDVYENAFVVVSAPKQDQIQKTIWAEIENAFPKFQKIRPYAKLGAKRLQVDPRTKRLESWHCVGYVAGTSADEVSTTRAQGLHRENMLIICDETPGMNLATLTAFQNTSTARNNKILVVGNPDSQVDALNLFCDTYPNVESFRVSALDHPNVVLRREIFPGATSVRSVKNRLEAYGQTSSLYESRVRGITPAQSEDSLIRADWVRRAFFTEEENSDFWGYIKKNGDSESRPALGIDVANSKNGDKAALCWGVSNVIAEIHEFQCENANAIADNVIYDDVTVDLRKMPIYETSKLKEYGVAPDYIGVDAVGVGVGTINSFARSGYIVRSLSGGQDKAAIPTDENGALLYNFSSLRGQMYFTFARELEAGEIRISIEESHIKLQLLKELITVKYKTQNGRTVIEPKEDITKRLGGKSPNMADAAVYWNWVRKPRSISGFYAPISGG